MKQAILKKGVVYTQSTPAASTSPDNVLIKVISSCISVGTLYMFLKAHSLLNKS